MSDFPKYRASIVNDKTVAEAVESQDQAIRAVQDEVVKMRLKGITRQVEAQILAVSDISPHEQEIRHFVYRNGETTAIEVKVQKRENNIDRPINQAAIEHILQVSHNKPLGYAIVSDPESLKNYTIASLKSELEEKGLKTELMPSIYIPGQVIMIVYDEDALQELLDEHKDILGKAGWPMTAREFAIKVNKGDEEKVEPYTELFTLIADAFADYTNSGRIENVIGPYNSSSHFAP